MTDLCNRCRQSEAFQGDSWCLACSSLEALGGELRERWGVAGARALATDLLVSTVRQVRAIRRLSLTQAGGTRAGVEQLAGPGRASSVRRTDRPPEPLHPPPRVPLPPPPVPPAREASVKSEHGSEESESESEGEVAPAASAKVKPSEEEGVRHTRSGEPRDKGRGRERDGGGDLEESRGSKRRHEEKDRERRKEHKSSGHKSKRSGKKTHRAGAKHQRLYRAAEDSHGRYHYKKPGTFWDQEHTRFR